MIGRIGIPMVDPDTNIFMNVRCMNVIMIGIMQIRKRICADFYSKE